MRSRFVLHVLHGPNGAVVSLLFDVMQEKDQCLLKGMYSHCSCANNRSSITGSENTTHAKTRRYIHNGLIYKQLSI